MLLKEDLSSIEPVSFNVDWEYAKTLLESIAGSTISADMNAEKIYIEAQCYAIGFYEKFGFQVTSEEFLEDGIPHVEMIRYETN